MEVKDESIRVQPHERHAVTLNEDDEASAREIFDILMKMRDQRQGSTFKVEEVKALKAREEGNEGAIEDLMREQRIHLTMHMLNCSREKAEKIVKNFEKAVKR